MYCFVGSFKVWQKQLIKSLPTYVSAELDKLTAALQQTAEGRGE